MGILNENVSVDGDVMKVGDRSIKLISVKDPADLPWKDLEIDVVIESTGIFRDNDSLNKHLNAGAKKVLLTVPPKDEIDATIVLGVNDEDLSPSFTPKTIVRSISSFGGTVSKTLAPALNVCLKESTNTC